MDLSQTWYCQWTKLQCPRFSSLAHPEEDGPLYIYLTRSALHSSIPKLTLLGKLGCSNLSGVTTFLYFNLINIINHFFFKGMGYNPVSTLTTKGNSYFVAETGSVGRLTNNWATSGYLSTRGFWLVRGFPMDNTPGKVWQNDGIYCCT